MATYGKFEVTPVSGIAGTTEISAKLATRNTGRAEYIKYAKHYMTNQVSKFASIALKAAGKPAFMTLGETTKEVAYNILSSTFNVTATNAAKFKLVKESGKTLTLSVNSGYTVSGLEGTFTGDPGDTAEFNFQIKVGIAANNTGAATGAKYKVQFWNGTTYVDSDTIALTQGSADAGLTITADPASLGNFSNAGADKTLAINSNFAYNIVENNGTDVSWLKILNAAKTAEITAGTSGTTNMVVRVDAQEVAALARSTQINFVNPVSGTILLTLDVNQLAGVARSISLSVSSLSFAQNEYNVVKNFNVIANDIWYSEESTTA